MSKIRFFFHVVLVGFGVMFATSAVQAQTYYNTSGNTAAQHQPSRQEAATNVLKHLDHYVLYTKWKTTLVNNPEGFVKIVINERETLANLRSRYISGMDIGMSVDELNRQIETNRRLIEYLENPTSLLEVYDFEISKGLEKFEKASEYYLKNFGKSAQLSEAIKKRIVLLNQYAAIES